MRITFSDTQALNTALPYDEVEYQIKGTDEYGNPTAQVTKIIKRNKNVFVGMMKEVVDKETNEKKLGFVPDDRKFYPDVEITNLDEYTDLAGKKFVIKMQSFDNPNAPMKAEITAVIGNAGEHETEMQSAVLDRGLVLGFDPAIEEAAAKLKEQSADMIAKEKETRRDMTDRVVFTIDPFDAKDFDDALSVKTLDNGNYEIGVHIADPSFFVRPGDVIDQEAVERATSIYLVDRTIPMLPEVLSNDLCSLNPNEEKLTFSAVFEISPQAEIVDRWFGETVTYSKRRFNYEEAQEILDTGNGDFVEELQILEKIAKQLKKEKIKNGAIEFESKEVKFKLDENYVPVSVVEKERTFTMEMIEEFMLLANREVSKFVSLDDQGNKTNNPFIYRVHEPPKQEKVYAAAEFLRNIGFEVEFREDGNISSSEINRILDEYKGTELEGLISLTILRSMKKASYSTDNIGHFGLSFKYYSHFTSPIRRYPDMIAHRLLRRYLAGEEVPKTEKKNIQKLAEHSSEMEVKAVDAERASIKYKYAEYFSTRIGDEVEALVTGVAKYGIFIEDLETKGEGMINVRNMGGDYYEYDEKKMQLVGRNTKRKFKIGDHVKAKIVNVDMDERNIDFELIN